MYEQTDKAIRLLNRQYVTLFGRLKSLVSYDELNVLGAVNRLFEELEELVKKVHLRLAEVVYEESLIEAKKLAKEAGIALDNEDTDEAIDIAWLMAFYNSYDPVTKYVYSSETDRKRGRLVEAMIAAENKAAEVETAMKIWSRQTTQACIEITDNAAQKAYKDVGIDKVKWETERDDRVCRVCEEREGTVYPIDRVPPKPHYNCRCWLRPFVEGKTIWNL